MKSGLNRLISFKINILNILRNMKLETIFLIIFLGFGTIFVFMIPPGWNTDEPDHTYRIYQLSTGNLFSEKVTSPAGFKAYGGSVSSGLVNMYDDAGVKVAGADAVNGAVKVDTLYESHPNILKYKDDGALTSINFSGAALYSPITYALYIPIFLMGKFLSFPFFITIMAARLIGLFATGIAFYFAIKHIKIGKWIIFVVGLLPVTVVQSASVGADAPLIAVSVLFVAYVTNVIFSKTQPTIKQYGLLAIIGLLLTVIKLAYAPLTLLILAIPLVRNKISKRSLLLAVTAILIAVIPGLIWTSMVSYVDTNSNLQSNFPLQQEFILSNPILYLKTLYYTFFTNEQAPLDGLFGNAIWGSVPLPAIFSYLAVCVGLSAVGVKNSREIVLGKANNVRKNLWRVSFLGVCIITAVLISTVLYVYSSTLYQSSIIGLQARYFIPLLPLILLAFYGNFFKNQKSIKVVIMCLCTFILIGAVLTTYHRLYQTLPTLLR